MFAFILHVENFHCYYFKIITLLKQNHILEDHKVSGQVKMKRKFLNIKWNILITFSAGNQAKSLFFLSWNHFLHSILDRFPLCLLIFSELENHLVSYKLNEPFYLSDDDVYHFACLHDHGHRYHFIVIAAIIPFYHLLVCNMSCIASFIIIVFPINVSISNVPLQLVMI